MDGTTTNNYSRVYEKDGGGNGLIELVAIKNTGQHSMTVLLTISDAFGGTPETEETILVPGTVWMRDTFHALSGLTAVERPYGYWAIDVKSTLPGNSTTFSLRGAG